MITNYTKLKENRIILSDAIPLQKPFTLLIEPSSLCNFRCKMCFQSAEHKGKFAQNRGNMTLDTYTKVIEQAKAWGKIKVLKLCIFGEPFMNPLFAEMLRIAKESDIAERIETTTNASLLTPDLSKKLVEYGIDYIRVSIYGHNEEKHREVTKASVSLQQIHENLKNLQIIKKNAQKNLPFIAAKTLDTFDQEYNQAFYSYFSDVTDELYLDQPHNWVQPHGENFIGNLYDCTIETQSTTQFACPMPFTTFAVRSNGDVAPCCIDWFGATIIGSVHEKTLFELWNGTEHKKIMHLQLSNEKHKNISCASCEVFKNGHYTKDIIDGASPDILL